MFNKYDGDSSGTIDAVEFEMIFASMSVGSDDVGDLASELISLVDGNGNGKLDMDEFKVLMVMAFEPQSEEDEIDDLDAFFKNPIDYRI